MDMDMGMEHDIDDLEEAQVEKLISHKYYERGGGGGSGGRGDRCVQYLVRWQGLGQEEDEWVEREELVEAEEPVPRMVAEYDAYHRSDEVERESKRLTKQHDHAAKLKLKLNQNHHQKRARQQQPPAPAPSTVNVNVPMKVVQGINLADDVSMDQEERYRRMREEMEARILAM